MRLGRIFAQAFVTGFSGAAMPGPVLAACIALTVALGFAAGPLVVFGHFVLEVAVVLLIAAGLHRHLTRPDSPLVRGIGLVGGGMLLYMAWGMFHDLPALSLAGVKARPVAHGPVAAGLLLSAANPYFWLWWATIGLGLLTESLSRRGRAGLAAFYTGHILSDLAWYSFVAALIAGGRGLLTDGLYRGLIGACALMLVFFGARFVWLSLHPPMPVAVPADA
ncbi:MAG: LysE family transporter [Armatimonadetes bacterium]|nr:LysE family transporter [Armatimonadota bacterium]